MVRLQEQFAPLAVPEAVSTTASRWRAVLAWPSCRLLQRWSERWGMVVLVLTLLCWLWGLFFWLGGQQKRQLLVDRGAELALMASAVAQQSSGLLRSIGHDLRTLDVWLATHPDADPLTDLRFLALVDEMRRSSAGMMDIRMVAADGSLFYLPSLDAQPRANVRDREYLRFHDSGAGREPRSLHVSAPVRSRVSDRWDIPVSMRMTPPLAGSASANAPHGPMQVMFAAVSLDRLVAEHERTRFKPDGAINLVRSDGIVLSRAPMLATYIGQDISGSPHFGESIGQNERGSFVSSGSMTDGVTRLVSFERLADFPVTVLVSRGLDDIYSSYNDRRRSAVQLSAALSSIVIAITIALLCSQRSRTTLRRLQEELRRLATTDELTGIMNRRAFMEAAAREFERAQRYSRPAAVLMLDIDHFKRVNDQHGHAAGDQVLTACTARWHAALREQDLLGRLGGEEFCVLLPETSAADALHIGERLRVLIGNTPMLGGRCNVSVSVGWTAFDATDTSFAMALERCDQSLYAAKDGGRNCVRPLLRTGRPSDSVFGALWV